eukprot:gene18303-20126_t
MAYNIRIASVICFLLIADGFCSIQNEADDDISSVKGETTFQSFKIEGKVTISDEKLKGDWISETQVLVDGGEHVGFLSSDGSFVVNLIPPGSHVVEISSPNYIFEKVRVDITKGGKIRARRANFIQPNSVHVIPYPLRFHASSQAPFFEAREVWKITDMLLNPMVLMMVLPLLFLFVMPKLLANADPETQKEMQSPMNVFQNQRDMPEISDLFANWFSKPKKKSGPEKPAALKSGRRR